MRSPGRTCRPWQPRRCPIGAHDPHFPPLHHLAMCFLRVLGPAIDMCSAVCHVDGDLIVPWSQVLHTEMFFDPQVHTLRGVEFTTFMTGFVKAIKARLPHLVPLHPCGLVAKCSGNAK